MRMQYFSLSENVYIEVEDEGETVRIEIYRRDGSRVSLEELALVELTEFQRILEDELPD